MKVKHLAVFIAALILLPFSVEAQPRVMGVVGAGASFGNVGTLSIFFGGDIDIYTDTARGFTSYTRIVGQFTDHYKGQEDEGVAIWQMIERDFTNWLYLGIGGGLTYVFKEGSNEQAAGIKLEAGWTPIDGAALIIGIDYLPDAGTDGEDIKFIYAGVNLLH